jgi:hypothetical protein
VKEGGGAEGECPPLAHDSSLHSLLQLRSLFVSHACHVQAKRDEGPARLHAGKNSARGGERRGFLRHTSLHRTDARERRERRCVFFRSGPLTVNSDSITRVLAGARLGRELRGVSAYAD